MSRIKLIFKQKILAVVFIIFGLAGSLITFFYIENIKNESSQQDNYYEVVVALEDIEKDDVFSADALTKQKISKNIFSEKYLIKVSEIEGKKSAAKIAKGEIISSDSVQGFNLLSEKTLRFSSYIPRDKKAVTVPVVFYWDLKLISAGDKVDIISTFYDKEKEDLTTETIILNQEIILFSTPQSSEEMNNSEDDFNIINIPQTGMDFSNGNKIIATFYLDIIETEKIFLSLEKGRINISICSSKIF